MRKIGFSGEINKIDEEFLQYVSELTLALFSPDNLVSKMSNDRLITANDWIQYIDEYVKAFNYPSFKSENLVSVSIIFFFLFLLLLLYVSSNLN